MGHYKRQSSGMPAWLIILVATAFVFGGFYVWNGVQTFFRTGGLGVVESTAQAVALASATAVRAAALAPATLSPRPSATPIPECMDFRVNVPQAIVRDAASASGAIETQLAFGTSICVLAHEGEWYAIDLNPSTRRIDLAYMHESVIAAVNPTPTPTRTLTPSRTPTLTITPSPTHTPMITPSLTPTPGDEADVPPTPLPTVTPVPTEQPLQSA